jgi:plasmid stability protein
MLALRPRSSHPSANSEVVVLRRSVAECRRAWRQVRPPVRSDLRPRIPQPALDRAHRRVQYRYHLPARDSIDCVKQLLLRVPEDIHRRLAARAAREGRSVNAVATEILDAAADADSGDRRAQLRAAAAAAGTLRTVSARPVSAARRQRITESTSGLGPQVDRLLARERERP